MTTVSKKYSIQVWDVEFYKVDEDGNALLNEDGSVKLFYENPTFDYSYLADNINPNDLVEFNGISSSAKS